MKQIEEIWKYRELGSELFITFLKLRHVGSILGVLWTLINPLIFIATYWLIFSYVLRMGIENYHLFLIPGYLAWNFTFGSIVNASESILNSRYLITKIAFPNELIVFSSIAVSLFDFILSITLYIATFSWFFPILNWTLVYLPLVLLLQIILTAAISLIVSTMSVFFKDVPKLILVFGTVIFFLTPIFYPIEMVPEQFRKLFMLNPFAYLVDFYHQILYYHQAPSTNTLIFFSLLSFLLFFLGLKIFNRYKYTFAELS